jgi:hypothetical protein
MDFRADHAADGRSVPNRPLCDPLYLSREVLYLSRDMLYLSREM